MFRFLIFFSMVLSLFAEKIEITSQKFIADETKLTTKFYGDVLVKKGDDILKSKEVIVKFNKKRKPLSYEAKSNVTFKIRVDSKNTYQGRANKLIYKPVTKEYKLIGDVSITEINSKKRIFAKEITLSEKSGKAEVLGDKSEPVKFIFELEDVK